MSRANKPSKFANLPLTDLVNVLHSTVYENDICHMTVLDVLAGRISWDYNALAQKLIQVDPLSEGALAVYDHEG